MSSQINYISINENFPVPGQDNDTQVFRDNFDTIKQSLRAAKDEITELQNSSALTTEDNDFNLKQLRNLVLGKAANQLQNYGNPIANATQEINFANGLHHVLRVSNNINLTFNGFPGDPNIPAGELLVGMGKITLELYGDGSVRAVTFNQSGSVVTKTSGFPSTPFTVQSATDPVLLEIYRYNSSLIFIRYLGQFV